MRAAQTYIEGWEEGANLFKDVDKNGKPTKLEEGESPAVWDPVVWESSRKNHIKLQYSKVIMFFSYNITTDISPSEKLKDVWHKKTFL